MGEIDRVSGNLQDRANDINQVDEVSDMAPAFRLCGSLRGGERFRKWTMAHLSLWEKAVP